MSQESRDNAEAGILFEIIKARYGERLSVEQLEEVQKGVKGIAELTRELRKIRLNNNVEPFYTFKPYRGDKSRE